LDMYRYVISNGFLDAFEQLEHVARPVKFIWQPVQDLDKSLGDLWRFMKSL
jgi:hypothetical protein